jgi:hypothetical protein
MVGTVADWYLGTRVMQYTVPPKFDHRLRVLVLVDTSETKQPLPRSWDVPFSSLGTNIPIKDFGDLSQSSVMTA